jgi:hypothetical protein
MSKQVGDHAPLSSWYRGARGLIGREWRNYEIRAAEYESVRDPALIASARFSIKWELAYALSLRVASSRDGDEHAHFQSLMERLASEYPEVPWNEADEARFEKWRAWGRTGGRRMRAD